MPQLEHEELPAELVNVPGLQRLQLTAPLPEYVPAPHDRQALLPGDG